MSIFNKITTYRKRYTLVNGTRIDRGHTGLPKTYKIPNMLTTLSFREPSRSLLVFVSIRPRSFQFQNPLPGGGYQSAWNKEYSISYSLGHVLYLLLIQSLFLKKVHQIIGQHQKLKPDIVPSIAVRDYLIQSKAVYAFFDEVFTAGSLV